MSNGIKIIVLGGTVELPEGYVHVRTGVLLRTDMFLNCKAYLLEQRIEWRTVYPLSSVSDYACVIRDKRKQPKKRGPKPRGLDLHGLGRSETLGRVSTRAERPISDRPAGTERPAGTSRWEQPTENDPSLQGYR
jgi:hypothetical protein